MMTKKEVRTVLRQKRDAMSIPDYMNKNAAITKTLLHLEEFGYADNTLLLYASINNEVDTTKIFQAAITRGLHVGFPRVIGDTMNFYRITNDDELIYGYFGIREPEPITERFMEPKDGLVIVPGLGFDPQGNRTGYGKGFYDCYLRDHPQLFKIGLAYDFQVVDSLETDEFDVPLDMIVTESRIIRPER